MHILFVLNINKFHKNAKMDLTLKNNKNNLIIIFSKKVSNNDNDQPKNN
jgi:hypothetical protein